MQPPIRRVNPRRPYQLTSHGRRRIVLGGFVDAHADATCTPRHAAPARTHDDHPNLPLRTTAEPDHCLMSIVQSDAGALDRHAQETIAAAALLAGPSASVVVVVLGELEDDLSALGADKILVLPDCDVRSSHAQYHLHNVLSQIDHWRPRHVLLPDNDAGTGDLGRRLAVHRGSCIATSVIELDPKRGVCFRRSALGSVYRALPHVLLLEPGVADTRLPFVGRGERIPVLGALAHETHVRHLGIIEPRASELSLEEADFIVAVGNGVTDVPLFQELAAEFGAALGASRVVVDDGRLPRDRQIGATGKTVKAGLYLAFGISGAIQHLQGIKDCRRVIAVNIDESASIIKRADLSLIGDATAVARSLLDIVRTARARSKSSTERSQ